MWCPLFLLVQPIGMNDQRSKKWTNTMDAFAFTKKRLPRHHQHQHHRYCCLKYSNVFVVLFYFVLGLFFDNLLFRCFCHSIKIKIKIIDTFNVRVHYYSWVQNNKNSVTFFRSPRHGKIKTKRHKIKTKRRKITQIKQNKTKIIWPLSSCAWPQQQTPTRLRARRQRPIPRVVTVRYSAPPPLSLCIVSVLHSSLHGAKRFTEFGVRSTVRFSVAVMIGVSFGAWVRARISASISVRGGVRVIICEQTNERTNQRTNKTRGEK